MKDPFKILILSVGSLLGQCVLDVLEGRRQEIKVIGLNSQAQNPCNFRCDRTYLVPLSARRQAFKDRFLEILALESPNLILPGRDDRMYCFWPNSGRFIRHMQGVSPVEHRQQRVS